MHYGLRLWWKMSDLGRVSVCGVSEVYMKMGVGIACCGEGGS